jgi:LCP family protein required for cell wall assembly
MSNSAHRQLRSIEVHSLALADRRASAQRPKNRLLPDDLVARGARRIWEDTPMRVPPHDPSLEPDTRRRAPRWRLLTRVLVAATAAALLLVGAVTGLFLERQRAYDRNIRRIPGAFPAESNRPAQAPGRAQNWLLVGSDRRADQATTGRDANQPLWRYGAQRADTIMLVHLPADRDRAYLVSFPRDAWVPIQGHGNAKLNAAISFGGPPLLVATIEQLTGVRVDHVAILDFEGFRSMTDALGGVDVQVTRTVWAPAQKVLWPAGTHHLDGARALDFVRQRHNLPGGDLGRIKRQQAFLKALSRRVVDRGTLANPLKLNAFLEAATKAVSVDESLTTSALRSLALQFRSARAGDLVFLTAPVAGTGAEGRQSVVYLDRAKGQPLYRALREDTVEGYLAGAGGTVNQVDQVR